MEEGKGGMVELNTHRDGWKNGRRKGMGHRNRRTDVVRVDMIHAHESRDGLRTQAPLRHISNNGELARVQVVHDDAVELPHTNQSANLNTRH